MKKKCKLKLSIWQFLALGYLIVILVGSALLSLPFATSKNAQEPTTYMGALFTAASATCVTGLSPYNTGAHWSLFGQIVILLLIQFGGLGFMSFVSTVFLIFRHKVGLYQRTALMSVAGDGRKYEGVKPLLKRIFLGTAIFELAGACLLSIRFCRDFGGKGVYYALWHSVSAFCNAGFDVLGGDSLSAYATDPLVCLTICALIVMGGLGFCVWGDFIHCRGNYKKFQLNTKVVLWVSGLLIVISTGLYLLFEWDEAYAAYDGFGEKLLCALFSAISPRTAGFYTTDPSALSDSGYLVTLILMFIGGSSGSTAGGLKIGTFAVIIMGMITIFRGRKDINIGKKRIDNSLLSQALAIFTACLTFILIATLAICAIEPNKRIFGQVLFECVSALGTVGLTQGLTPTLSTASQVIIIILMYAGRVGILTLALAFGEKRTTAAVRKPVDYLLIG